jgi:hypothetical protein
VSARENGGEDIEVVDFVHGESITIRVNGREETYSSDSEIWRDVFGGNPPRSGSRRTRSPRTAR